MKAFIDIQMTERLIISIKITIASILALLVAHILHLPTPEWVLTSIIVMLYNQAHVGNALQNTYIRILFTITGGLIGIISLFFLKHHILELQLIIIISCVVFGYAAHGKNIGAGILGAVTVAGILLNHSNSFYIIIMKPIAVIFGIVIAFVVIRYVFPIYASVKVNKNFCIILENMGKLYLSSIQLNETSDVQKQQDQIFKMLAGQTKLLFESRTEHLKNIDYQKSRKVFQHIQQIYTIIAALNCIINTNLNAAQHIHHLPLFQNYSLNIHAQYNQLNILLKNMVVTTTHSSQLDTISSEKFQVELLIACKASSVYITSLFAILSKLEKELNILKGIISSN